MWFISSLKQFFILDLVKEVERKARKGGRRRGSEEGREKDNDLPSQVLHVAFAGLPAVL